MSRLFNRHRHGFTLVEMLVVIAIIAVLAAIAFPSYKSMLESSRATQCTANLREIFTGIQGYVTDNNGQYPQSRKKGRNPEFWIAAIGPYLSEGRRWEPWPQDGAFACPSVEDDKHGWGGDFGINGFQVGATLNANNENPGLRIAKASALSTTLLVADAWDDATSGQGAWQVGFRIGPNAKFSGTGIATRHKGRANVLYFDGHVGQVTAEQLEDEDFVEKLGGPRF
jgi:prepilin-type N-terminal cleavage/methylation domain-containing protein/prepilin-type processing-associated H-X9-DG protein